MQGNTASEHHSILLAELAQAKELIIQLEAHFENNSSEFCKTLTSKILSSIEKSIYMANSFNPVKQHAFCSVLGTGDYPQSANSPHSENSDQPFKDQNHKEMSKKRKTLPKWTSQFRLGAAAGETEVYADDGFSWRKYGQKDILGAKYPRSYYRCTHQKTQGCLATKQVQRSDKDPSVFDITYHGAHTCHSRNQSTATLACQENQQKQSLQELQQQNESLRHQDLLLNFQTDLQVKTEGLNCDTDNALIRSSWPTFFSPTTSESTYFSASPCRMNSLELEYKVQTSESDVPEMISTPMSSCSSTILDVDFMFALCTDLNLDQFDASSFFP